MNKKDVFRFCCGAIGALFIFFFSWEFSITIAPWIALPLLMYFFRGRRRWYETLPVVLLMMLSRFFSIHGGWDMEIGLEIAFSLAVNVPILAALYLDRFFHKKMRIAFSLLLFPCVMTVFDYLITFINLGMVFSVAYTQNSFLALAQISSVLGSFAIGFIVALFAPFTMLFFDNVGDLKKAAKPIVAIAMCFVIIVAFGFFRIAFSRPQSQTVRVASISVAHEEDYWASVTDKSTPRADAADKKPELSQVCDELFRLSTQAAEYGAKIIFWSEGNAPLYEDDYDAFIERAQAFAKENDVYFMPAAVVFRYDMAKNDNIAIIINPRGEIEYRYEKSISWYPTDSDGMLPLIDTPYGKISTAICFDMDYPNLIHQANQADIMLVPAFDTQKIDDYHTRVAFLRGMENGFSVIRQSNAGSSIAADYLGNTLTYQNYFRTTPRIMITDVPQKGVNTLYGLTGEIFLWLVIAFLPLMFIIDFTKLKRMV